MKQHIQNQIQTAIKILQEQGELSADISADIQIERTRDKQHGDFASNIALMLAKAAQQKPRELAEKIVKHLPTANIIKEIVIAGPGFINFYLTEEAYLSVITDILTAKEKYGRSNYGKAKRIHMEFVSANPTGPLHVGHGRGAAYCATIADLLEAVGYQVQREYYVNDAGRQMHILAASVWLRYIELFHPLPAFPKNGYKGDYVVEIAKQLKQKYDNKYLQPLEKIFAELPQDEIVDTNGNTSGDKDAYIDALIARAKELLTQENYEFIFQTGMHAILEDIKNDLEEFGVKIQSWFFESELVRNGALKEGLEKLQAANATYENEGALWFKATEYGDEKDRVVVRENGQHTYFGADVAYHSFKYAQGFDHIIDIFGSDHHGYVPRINAFLTALGLDTKKLTVLLIQFAILYRGKERVQMSTRGGTFVTLRELREEVGKDAARYFYIMRKYEQHLDFDLELAKSHSNDNPVYYIQYAHARVCSVFRQMQIKKISFDQMQGLQNLNLLNTEQEQNLLRILARFPEMVHVAAINYEPHTLANYLQELAQNLHAYYGAQQFLVDNAELRNARLCLIIAVQQVVANGLALLGLSAPEMM